MNDEKNAPKMTKSDKIVTSVAVGMITGMGIGYGVYLRKHYLATIAYQSQQLIRMDKALAQTIELVGESLKK